MLPRGIRPVKSSNITGVWVKTELSEGQLGIPLGVLLVRLLRTLLFDIVSAIKAITNIRIIPRATIHHQLFDQKDLFGVPSSIAHTP